MSISLLFLGTLALWGLRPYFLGVLPISSGFVLGPFSFHYYGLAIASGILASYLAAWILWPQERQLFDRLILPLVVGGIIGARLGFVLTQLSYYLDNPVDIFILSQGGLSIHGALAGGALTLWLFVQGTKGSFWRLADRIAPLVALAQAVGRFGNFANQEAIGGPTSLPWKLSVAPLSRPLGFEHQAFFHPLFLYEALGSFFLFVLLTHLALKGNKGKTPGWILGWYLVLYSSLRFGLEFIRLETIAWGWLTVAQWVSLGLIFVGITLIIRRGGFKLEERI